MQSKLTISFLYSSIRPTAQSRTRFIKSRFCVWTIWSWQTISLFTKLRYLKMYPINFCNSHIMKHTFYNWIDTWDTLEVVNSTHVVLYAFVFAVAAFDLILLTCPSRFAWWAINPCNKHRTLILDDFADNFVLYKFFC